MGRAPCCDKNGLKKGPWTLEEDQKLIDYIQKHGHGSWRTLPKNAGLLRCGKSCRLRWTNYLRPDIKRGRFTFEEEETIIQLHSFLGNKWSAIAGRLPGRTDNEIKNYWNTHIRKRLLRMGIDPVTHNPRLDLLDLSSLLTSSLYNPNKFDVSRLLGIDPLVNAELLKLATALISTQHQNPNFLSQNLQENQFPNPQFQNSFQTFQTEQFQPTPIPDIPVCSTSNAQFLNETQFIQPNVEQFPSNPTNFSCQNVAQNLCQDLTVPSKYSNDDFFMDPNLDDCFQPLLNFCCPVTEPALDPICDNSNVQSNSNHSFQNFTSVFSTPASSPTPLNSSSTYVNSSTEDERDSYCSNSMLNSQIRELLFANEFL